MIVLPPDAIVWRQPYLGETPDGFPLWWAEVPWPGDPGHLTLLPRPDYDGPNLCECGCGQPAPIATRTNRRLGVIKGQPLRFVFGHRGRIAEEYRVEDLGYSTPCWIWRGVPTPSGYGSVSRNGRSVAAHRDYYERLRGPIPPGLQLDHLCHNADASCPGGSSCRHRRCVNPDHLEPVTQTENVRRGHAPSIRIHHSGRCAAGHLMSGANLYVSPDGKERACRACGAERARLRRLQRRRLLGPPKRISGERHPAAKLTAAEVTAARTEYRGRFGEKAALARRYGVSKQQMGRILSGDKWKTEAPGDAHRVTVLPKEERSAWVWDWVPDLMGYRLRERRDDDDD